MKLSICISVIALIACIFLAGCELPGQSTDNTTTDHPVGIPFTPQGNIDMKNYYSIQGVSYETINQTGQNYGLSVNSNSSSYQSIYAIGKYPYYGGVTILGGYGLRIHRNLSETATNADLVYFIEGNTGSTKDALVVQNLGSGRGETIQMIDSNHTAIYTNGQINASCFVTPSGGKVCGNSTCTTFYSPNGLTVIEACN
jgi:hypothetical protein